MSVKVIFRTCASIRVRAGARTCVIDSACIIESARTIASVKESASIIECKN